MDACVETARAGEVCAKACTADAECRVDEGYVCDPVWHACLLPNMAAIVPKQCPAPAGLRDDEAFGASEALSTAAGAGRVSVRAERGRDRGRRRGRAVHHARWDDRRQRARRWRARQRARRSTCRSRSERASHFDPWLARDSQRHVIYAVWLGFDGRDQHQQIALCDVEGRRRDVDRGRWASMRPATATTARRTASTSR